MIEIKVTSREKARENCKCGADAVLCESEVDLQIAGEPEEIKHELIALVETFEKKPALALIWEMAIAEHTLDTARRDK